MKNTLSISQQQGQTKVTGIRGRYVGGIKSRSHYVPQLPFGSNVGTNPKVLPMIEQVTSGTRMRWVMCGLNNVMYIARGEEKEAGRIFEEIMAASFQNLMKNINLHF